MAEIAIITRCDVEFKLNSPSEDWSSDYIVSKMLSKERKVDFYCYMKNNIDEIKKGNLRIVNTYGNNLEYIKELLLSDKELKYVVSSSWVSLLKKIEHLKVKKILLIRAHKEPKTDKSEVHAVNKIADKVIVVSNSLKKMLVMGGYKKSKIIVIPNGFNEVFRYKKTYRKSHTIVYAGAILPLKGLDLVFEVFKKYKLIFADAELHLYGDAKLHGHNHYYHFRKKSMEKIGIYFHGVVRQKELNIVFNACEIGILIPNPKECFETFGKSIQEMQVCGCPVIVSKSGGLPERVINKKTGYILNKYNKTSLLKLLIHHNSLKEDTKIKISQNCINNPNNHSWKEIIPLYEKALCIN